MCISRVKSVCGRRELFRPLVVLAIAVVVTKYEVINETLCAVRRLEVETPRGDEKMRVEEAVRRNAIEKMIAKAVEVPVYVRSAPYEFDVRMLVCIALCCLDLVQM